AAPTAGSPPAKRWLYQAPIQFCAIEGSAQAGASRPGQMVPAGRMLQTLSAVNNQIWYPQAQIAFSTATVTSIPVIKDPTPPTGTNGQLGDLDGADPYDAQLSADLC